VRSGRISRTIEDGRRVTVGELLPELVRSPLL